MLIVVGYEDTVTASANSVQKSPMIWLKGVMMTGRADRILEMDVGCLKSVLY
jgi:hypothetical protein